MSILTWLMIGFVCGLFARYTLDVTKTLLDKLRCIKVELDLGGGTTESQNRVVGNQDPSRTILTSREQSELTSRQDQLISKPRAGP